nr:hypothetical protein [Rhizobium sp. ACO-34A]
MCNQLVLPQQAQTDGNWDDVCASLYGHFTATFKCIPSPVVRGKTLVFDARLIDNDKEEGFWHVVTKGKGEDRLFDPPRARRITWISALLNGTAPGVSRFSYTEGDGTVKLYYWLKSEKYVLILAEKPKIVSLVTAFYIDQTWTLKDLEKREKKGIAF